MNTQLQLFFERIKLLVWYNEGWISQKDYNEELDYLDRRHFLNQ